ncbi:apolipoprotein N-acyltransferase [Candidatus Saganbacteria bacterium]|nr:apolipoprotein N-acyltransferase [Candidatus Saganbacteria bacterium]
MPGGGSIIMGIQSWILPIFSGLLLALSFPKFNFFWLAWAAMLPLFFALNKARSQSQAVWCGINFGGTFFVLNLFWLFTLWRFAGAWIILGWLALTIFQTLFFVLFCWAGYWLMKLQTRLFPLLAALIWVMIEWLRAFGPLGLTAGDVGYSQVSILSLIQIANLVSVYGVSFLVILFNAALFYFWLNRRNWHFLIVAILLVSMSVAYGNFVLNQKPPVTAKAIKIALLQTNVDQRDRMNPAKIQEIIALHEQLTLQVTAEQPAIIVWPETAIFTFALNDPQIFSRLQNLARQSHAWLVLGMPYSMGSKAYNSLAVISPDGRVAARYDKQRLVPFGEYLPLRPLLYPWLKKTGYFDEEFSCDQPPQPLKFGPFNLAAAICFESIFPDVMKARVKPETDFILLVTNDAWFADSSAIYFHLNAGIFRAIENRRYFVQAGNSGLTAIIDPYGRIVASLKPHTRQALVFELALY